MTLATTSTRLILTVVLASAAFSSACRQPIAAAGSSEVTPGAAGTITYDLETTDVARILAGIPPSTPEAFTTVLQTAAWHAYAADARGRWTSVWSSRLQPVRSWADAELNKAAGNCQTLLHPFGGTDFLTAYLMFPGCEGYVLVGSDPVGQLPKFDGATPAQVTAAVSEIRRAFPEVFQPGDASYRRAAGPSQPGALRVLLVQLARLNARIVHASRFDLAANGRPLEAIPIRGGNARPAALSLTFEVSDGRPQSLVYLPAELDDAAMSRRPAVWTFLRLQAPFTTLLSPAAAMRSDRFRVLRELIVDQSRAILQDQPALPAGSLNSRRWAVSTLGPPPAAAFGPAATPTVALRKGSGSIPPEP